MGGGGSPRTKRLLDGESLMDFVFFLGRLHVLFLHIPIGVILVATILEWLVRRPSYAALERSLTLVWAIAAVSAILAVATGLMHVGEGGFDAATAGSHRLFAILTAVGATAVWLLRWKMPRVASLRLVLVALTFVAMLLATHYGSRLTHGQRFLSVATSTWIRPPA